MNYTEEQKAVIRETGNCVVVAAPGSGKTATITAMVQAKLETLRNHKGIIAISYTNKASAELRQRVRQGDADVKASFFGTIDRFFISEVIIPFGRKIWGNPSGDLRISKLEEVEVKHCLTLNYRVEDVNAVQGIRG